MKFVTKRVVYETLFVAVCLLLTLSSFVEVIGAVGVLLTFAHHSYAINNAEYNNQETKTQSLLFFVKEFIWLVYFIMFGAYAALVGTIVFLTYTFWRPITYSKCTVCKRKRTKDLLCFLCAKRPGYKVDEILALSYKPEHLKELSKTNHPLLTLIPEKSYDVYSIPKDLYENHSSSSFEVTQKILRDLDNEVNDRLQARWKKLMLEPQIRNTSFCYNTNEQYNRLIKEVRIEDNFTDACTHRALRAFVTKETSYFTTEVICETCGLSISGGVHGSLKYYG